MTFTTLAATGPQIFSAKESGTDPYFFRHIVLSLLDYDHRRELFVFLSP